MDYNVISNDIPLSDLENLLSVAKRLKTGKEDCVFIDNFHTVYGLGMSKQNLSCVKYIVNKDDSMIRLNIMMLYSFAININDLTSFIKTVQECRDAGREVKVCIGMYKNEYTLFTTNILAIDTYNELLHSVITTLSMYKRGVYAKALVDNINNYQVLYTEELTERPDFIQAIAEKSGHGGTFLHIDRFIVLVWSGLIAVNKGDRCIVTFKSSGNSIYADFLVIKKKLPYDTHTVITIANL